jgi:hypothetical protein
MNIIYWIIKVTTSTYAQFGGTPSCETTDGTDQPQEHSDGLLTENSKR